MSGRDLERGDPRRPMPAAAWALVALVLVVQWTWLGLDQHPPEGDALRWHTRNLEVLMGDRPSADLYEYYPPLVYWTAAPFCAAARWATGAWTPDAALAGILLVFLPLLGWSAWRLGGWAGVALTILSPAVLGWSRDLYLEFPLAAAVLWATAEMHEEEPRPWPLALALACGMLIKWTFPLYAAGAVLFCAWRWRGDPSRAWRAALLGGGLALLWYDGVNRDHDAYLRWEWAWQFLRQGQQAGQGSPAAWAPLGLAGLLTWPYALAAAACAFRRPSWPLFLQGVLAVALVTAVTDVRDMRYFAPAIPLFTCGIGAAAGRSRAWAAAVAAPLAALGLVGLLGWIAWMGQGRSEERVYVPGVVSLVRARGYGRNIGWPTWEDSGSVRFGEYSILGAMPGRGEPPAQDPAR